MDVDFTELIGKPVKLKLKTGQTLTGWIQQWKDPTQLDQRVPFLQEDKERELRTRYGKDFKVTVPAEEVVVAEAPAPAVAEAPPEAAVVAEAPVEAEAAPPGAEPEVAEVPEAKPEGPPEAASVALRSRPSGGQAPRPPPA